MKSMELDIPGKNKERFKTHLKNGQQSLLNFVMPPLCPITDLKVQKKGELHPEGWQALDFISEPFCAACGLPFELSATTKVSKESLCGACAAPDDAPFALTGPRSFNSLRAVARYDEPSAKLVLALKNSDRMDIAPVLAGLMTGPGKQMLAQCDFLIPVPLHRGRLWSRRFNQSAEIARHICRNNLSNKKLLPGLLRRIKPTPQQKGLSADQRRRNVQGAFDLAPKSKINLKGKNIVLVDDVLTTGATMKACARVLRKAGAAQVHGLVFARVIGYGSKSLTLLGEPLLA
jgi:ComF family protein